MPGKLLLLITIIFITSYTVSAQIILENAFPNLTFNNPLDLQNSGDGTDRIFVAEQAGRIKVFPNSSSVTSLKTFLNIADRVSAGGEKGLLGLAFHPDYENNGYFYVNYTTSNPSKTRISRFRVSSENPDSADKNSEVILLTFSQPFSNHNGGWIGFGPNDGYLYIGVGDGGGGGDPQNNAQNIETILGNILRIDVDNQDIGLLYAIPPGNPFADSSGSIVKENGVCVIPGVIASILLPDGYGLPMLDKMPGKKLILSKTEKIMVGDVTKAIIRSTRQVAITPNIFSQSGNTATTRDTLLPAVMFTGEQMFLN